MRLFGIFGKKEQEPASQESPMPELVSKKSAVEVHNYAPDTREWLEKQGFGLKEEGCTCYIANPKGEPISENFHEVRMYIWKKEEEEKRVLVGQIGARQMVLNPRLGDRFYFQSSEAYHNIGPREDLGDVFVGGSLTGYHPGYLLDLEGKRISQHHEHFSFKNGRIYAGDWHEDDIVEGDSRF